MKLTISRERKLRYFLLELRKKNVISKELYYKLAPTGSKPGILYGLPNVHKPNLSVRPILSAIGTHSYNLAKYLAYYTVSLLVLSRLKTPFSFVDELRNLNLDTKHVFMASFDVTFLFSPMSLLRRLLISSLTNYSVIPTSRSLSSKNCFVYR